MYAVVFFYSRWGFMNVAGITHGDIHEHHKMFMNVPVHEYQTSVTPSTGVRRTFVPRNAQRCQVPPLWVGYSFLTPWRGITPEMEFVLGSDLIVELVLGSDPRSGVWVGPPPPFLRLGWGGTPSQPHQMGSDPILGIVLGEDPSTPVCFGVGTQHC